jgi:hypothetical protein
MDDLFGVGAKDQMNLMFRGVHALKEALEINGTAGAGGCKDKFHATKQSKAA